MPTSTRLAEHLARPGAKQVCRLERTTICKGKQTTEVQHAISSATPARAAAILLRARWQSQWGIESLHWVRDVTFGEDQCQVKVGHAPQNLAAFRNAVISLLHITGHPEIAASRRGFSYQPLKLLKFMGIMKHRLAVRQQTLGRLIAEQIQYKLIPVTSLTF